MLDMLLDRAERFFFMSDEPVASGQAPDAPAPPPTSGDSTSQQLKKVQDELAATRLELQKIKDAELSEVERLKKHAAELEERAARSERESLRRRVAQEENVPVEALEYLSGNDEESLRGSAQRLVTLIGSKASAAAGSRTQPAAGQAPTMDEQIAAAERSGNRILSISLKNQKMRGI
jgi:hypothetical protein